MGSIENSQSCYVGSADNKKRAYRPSFHYLPHKTYTGESKHLPTFFGLVNIYFRQRPYSAIILEY